MIPFTFLARTADSGQAIALCLAGLGLGIYLFYRGFLLLQRRRVLLDTPVSKVRSASMGMVEISGLAIGPYTLVAPVTGKACYYHRTLVWEYKQAGRNKKWVKVAAECNHVPFYLDDNTGRVMVDPRGAELDLHRDFQQEFCDSFFTLRDEVPPSVHMILSRHGIMTTNKVKVQECCIKPKNALFVLGTLGENPGLELTPQPIPDEEHTTLGLNLPLGIKSAIGDLSLRISGDTSMAADTDSCRAHAASAGINSAARQSSPVTGEKLATTLMQAGITNPAAWAAAGLDKDGLGKDGFDKNGLDLNKDDRSGASSGPAADSPAAAARSHDFDSRPPVVLRKGDTGQTFLISWRSQRELANSFAWNCALMICGGPVLALLSLYLLLTLTHAI